MLFQVVSFPTLNKKANFGNAEISGRMNMEIKEKYRIKKNISNLIRSGILFSDRREGEKVIGMTLKSFLNLHNEEKIIEIYNRLNIKIKELFPISVNRAIESLMTASRTYVLQELWGGKRKQSKHRYALKLFFKLAFQDYPHIYQTLPSTVIFGEDEQNIESELLNSLDNKFLSALWFVLIGFEVINPFLDTSRPRKDFNESSENLYNYISLLDDIIKYWPVVGSLSSFHEIEIYKSQVEASFESEDFVSPLLLLGQLQNLCDLVEIRTSPENLTTSNDKANVLIPEGIWIDEKDMGKTRFWIFPINLRLIFCYSFEYGSWYLKVFEAISDYDEEGNEYVLYVISPEESRRGILDGKLSSDSVYEMRVTYSEISGEYLEKMEFQHMNHSSDWFDFSYMLRLNNESELHERFVEIINELYNDKPFGLCLPLINSSAWMTDTCNCLIAMDEKNIYLKDKGNVRHILKIADNFDGEYFQYIPVPNKIQNLSLLGLEVSEEKPLYLISRNEMDYPEIDSKDEIKKMIDSHIIFSKESDSDEKQDFAYIIRREAETYRRFKEAVFSTTFPGEITIYTLIEKDKAHRKICFNKCGVIIDLEKAITLYGMKKVTSLITIKEQ